jgi:hypothetical protein
MQPKEELMTKQSLAGYIRQHLAEMETRMEYGVPQAVIVEELNALGYSTNVRAFRNYLVRARAWRNAKINAGSVVNRPVPTLLTAPKSAGSSGFDYQGSPDDDELSKLI